MEHSGELRVVDRPYTVCVRSLFLANFKYGISMFLLVISVNLTVHGKDHTNTIFKVSLSIQLARKSTQSFLNICPDMSINNTKHNTNIIDIPTLFMSTFMGRIANFVYWVVSVDGRIALHTTKTLTLTQ
jgi:hypothetical protein